jgi:hypothetical protein
LFFQIANRLTRSESFRDTCESVAVAAAYERPRSRVKSALFHARYRSKHF